MSEWQPIETAPKDGSFVLVGAFIEIYPNPGKIFWYNTAFFITDKPKGKKGKWRCNNDDEVLEITPTHWMPLPAPPLP